MRKRRLTPTKKLAKQTKAAKKTLKELGKAGGRNSHELLYIDGKILRGSECD